MCPLKSCAPAVSEKMEDWGEGGVLLLFGQWPNKQHHFLGGLPLPDNNFQVVRVDGGQENLLPFFSPLPDCKSSLQWDVVLVRRRLKADTSVQHLLQHLALSCHRLQHIHLHWLKTSSSLAFWQFNCKNVFIKLGDQSVSFMCFMSSKGPIYALMSQKGCIYALLL